MDRSTTIELEDCMTAKSHGIKRRDFLKQGTLAGLGVLLGGKK